MPLKGNAPLITRKLLSAVRDYKKRMRRLPPALRHLENCLEWGDLLTVLHDLTTQPDVVKAAYAPYYPDRKSTRDAGIIEAETFVYLHNAYGRIAPVGFSSRIFSAEVDNGGHDQYYFNQLAGAKPEESALALLITVIRDLALDRLEGGEIVLAHLERTQDMCLRKRDQLMAGYEDGYRDHDWDALDDAFYNTVAHEDDSPWNVWDRHLNAWLRGVVQEKDRSNQLSSIYKAWEGLPPPTEKQIYEIESDKVTKASVEDWKKQWDAKNKD